MTMQIHDVSLEVLRTLTLVRHIGADEAPARKRLRKICDSKIESEVRIVSDVEPLNSRRGRHRQAKEGKEAGVGKSAAYDDHGSAADDIPERNQIRA